MVEENSDYGANSTTYIYKYAKGGEKFEIIVIIKNVSKDSTSARY